MEFLTSPAAAHGDFCVMRGVIPPEWRSRHAHRNVSSEPLVELVIAAARLGNWFEKVGTPATGARRPPTAEDIDHFLAVSRKYGYWLGTTDVNAAVGLRLPEFG